MRKKWMVTLLATVVLGSFLGGCGERAETNTESVDSGKQESQKDTTHGETIKIGCVTFNSGSDNYQSVWYDEIINYAKELVVDIIIFDPDGDSNKQKI